MAVLTNKYKDAIFEIRTLRENDLITTARLSYIDGDNAEFVHPMGDKMPMLHYNTPVKVVAFNPQEGFQMLAGTVFISTDSRLQVRSLKILQDRDRREYFRINLHADAEAYIVGQGDNVNTEDVNISSSLPGIVEDISLSGIQLACEQTLEKGLILVVEVQIFDKNMMFHCQVMRLAKEDPPIHYYGCSFLDHTDQEIDALCYELFHLQRIELRKRRKEEQAAKQGTDKKR